MVPIWSYKVFEKDDNYHLRSDKKDDFFDFD